MKRLIVFLLCIHTLVAKGQSIVSTNRTWHNVENVYINYPPVFMTEIIQFTTDSIIDGKTYKTVERSTDNQTWNPFGFIREDQDKKVWYRRTAGEQENLFYDFDLQLHDTLTAWSIVTCYGNVNIVPQHYYVYAIDSTLIGDTYRKQFNLSFNDTVPGWPAEQWIDSTGNPGGMLYNFVELVGRDSYSLLCYFENDILKFHNSYFDSCYVVTGINKPETAPNMVSVTPDPVVNRSVLKVSNTRDEQLQISFFDASGRMLKSSAFTDECILSKDEFPAGIWFYRITGVDQTLTGKFTVVN